MQNDLVLAPNGPLVDADGLETAIGWTLKPEGLCQDDVCVPVADPASIRNGDKIDLLAVAGLLDRPAVLDTESGVAAIGAPRALRRNALDLQAPDFVLPDLDGTSHALSDHRSKKRLLVAFSSW